MAFIHTNYLTGNDTTGTGSTGAPYKTVAKALVVAVSNDFIKVAGGQWVPVAGTFTFTNSSVTVATATSMVGLIAVNDIITFEDGQFGFDKFHIRITAVSTTTLTMGTSWSGPTQITSGVHKIDTFHYTTASNTVGLENVNWTSALPAGRTNLTISGGWSSDYTVQNGWTVARSTNASPSNVRLFTPSPTYIGDWRQNLVFDRFMCSRITQFLQLGTGDAPSESTFAVKEMAFIGMLGASANITGGSTSRFGIYNADSSTPVTLYIAPFNNAFWMVQANNIRPQQPSSSLATNFLVYNSLSGQTTDSFSAFNSGIGCISPGLQGSPNKVTLHTRVSYGSGIYANYPAAYGLIPFSGASYYFTKVYQYFNRESYLVISIGNNTSFQIEDVEYVGPFASTGRNGMALVGSIGQSLIDLSQEGKTIESFKPSIGLTFGSTGPALGVALNAVCQTNLSITQVRDAEGLKTIDSFSSVYFKDPVNGWLRVSSSTYFDPTLDAPIDAIAWKVVGVNNKIDSPFTITFRLKDDGLGSAWNKIGVQYGPNVNQIVVESVSLTTEFQDYLITIDPATISDWNQFTFPLYCGIACTIGNLNSTTNPYTNCFVESVTIS